MTITDPDRLAIIRKRRQEGRCVACGADAIRSALCSVCRETLRYCPHCEVIWEMAQPRPSDQASRRSTAWCPDCKRDYRGTPKRDDYLTRIKSKNHPRLGTIIKLYRSGATLDAIAALLTMPPGTLRSIITHARATGRWPSGLKRVRGQRSDLQKAST